MSEANTPFHPESQSQPELTDSDWQAEPAVLQPVLKGEASSMPQPEMPQPDELEAAFDLSQIFDASDLEDLTFDAPQATNRSAIAAWMQKPEAAQPGNQPPSEPAPEPPQLGDLVNLIQELNQCNGLLMERVSQLEEALERSQTALQDEVGRTQGGDGEQDWATVQEQVTNLFNQLEFAHQTNQRQQILVETLTGQLENSQERVAELEREAALVQQRYNEQAQLLAKSEHTSRDLQSRLQRQQRYTLQFKAALEKSLEVPTPQYEVGLSLEPVPAEAVPAAEVLFLPRAKQIQPWSAQAYALKAQPLSNPLSKSPWMKFQNQPIAVDAPGDRPAPMQPAPSPAPFSVPESPTTQRPAPVNQLDLPSFGLPLPQILPEPAAEPLEQPAGQMAAELDLIADPALKQQLDQAVKPLADLLAEALLNEAKAQPQAQPESPIPAVWSTAELDQSAQPTESHPAFADDNSADQLLAAVMADAEDALWQDLARLIDVSAEDVVKASLSGDLAAFETLDFDAVQVVNEPQTASHVTPKPAQPSRPAGQSAGQSASQPADSPTLTPANAVTVAPLLRRLNQTQVAAQQAESLELEQDDTSSLTAASWPSPVVYPLRPVKKRQSLAMVDLPSFPKG